MNLANKFDLLKEIIVKMNGLADARGVDRCAYIVDIVQRLSFLEKVLRDEDDNNDAAIKELTDKVDKLTEEVDRYAALDNVD